jgi:hypothetical protein
MTQTLRIADTCRGYAAQSKALGLTDPSNDHVGQMERARRYRTRHLPFTYPASLNPSIEPGIWISVASPALVQRYVLPDLLMTVGIAEKRSQRPPSL